MKIDEPYLVLIKDSIDQIFEYVGGKDKIKFLDNDLLKGACLTRLIVSGEYSVKISTSLKQRFPEVEWQQMKVARNFYVHAYGQINWELIWETIKNYLPDLKAKIEKILAELKEEI